MLGSVPPCLGQSAEPLTLDEVVAKLQDNLDSYDRSIPSFLADEHIDSTDHYLAVHGASLPASVFPGGSSSALPDGRDINTSAESVFRLRRDVDPERHIPMLDESREIASIDGKPANGRDIDAPATFSGAFSGGLALVSKAEQACMRYTLEPVRPGRPIVVRFVSVPAQQRPKQCILAEDGSGQVAIDPASMQIAKIEVNVPRHLLIPRSHEGRTSPPVYTRWKVQVDLKPVVLDAHTFWLPEKISSVSSTEQEDWSFVATYRNYHLLQVHSRILIPSGASEKP
jgi:hypothetical protein